MKTATSWTAVTSEAIHRFRAGESEGSVPSKQLGSMSKAATAQAPLPHAPRPGGKCGETLSLLANAVSRNSRFILLFRVFRVSSIPRSVAAPLLLEAVTSPCGTDVL